ncbi:site-specific integrase [Yanshouia hominis]|uniref:Site-specific integrase n=1 Tax=Yanshouia hominis TaxID=2763673 RepID=A0ABR7NM41_9FIRM|nr:site-specific integrase [Yanshouia hominis]MBC8577476.1 site-specific integrase [Yanshouia hominis]
MLAHAPDFLRVDSGLPLTMDMIDAYLEDLQKKGRQAETIRAYRKSLCHLYESLPEQKIIRKESLPDLKDFMRRRGYTAGTINVGISAANGFLHYYDRRDLQLIEYDRQKNYKAPRMTRSEYLHLLRTAKALDDMRAYLLVKLFVTTDLPIHSLPGVTAQAVSDGLIPAPAKKGVKPLRIPQGLREEFLTYTKENGIASGPVFRKRNGEAIDRKMVDLYIRQLCEKAGIDPAKGNPRCLKRLYQSTRSEIESQINLEALVAQLQNTMLDNEQRQIGWSKGGSLDLERNGGIFAR